MSADRQRVSSTGRLTGERPRLYDLLPAFLRYRDQSEPLEAPLAALMGVLERQYAALERDVGRLYDDWFIETCQEWLAPYLGDLLGVSGLDRPEAWLPSQRTRIANALTYRRWKGTPAALERVARDVTGWPCRVRLFFEDLAVSQSPAHPRTAQGAVLDVRDRGALARLGGPFDSAARRPQISGASGLRPAVTSRAGYNLPNLGLYFWRLQSYPARRWTARKVSPGCYTLNPLGVDQPLFNRRHGGGELPAVTSERQVPGPVSRELLAQELEARRAGRPAATGYLGDSPVVEILDPHTGSPLPWQAIEIADLSGWRQPWPVAGGSAAAGGPTRVALDPELGRLAFARDFPLADDLEVSYQYGQAGDIGGGPYFQPAADTAGGAQPALAVGEAEAPAVDGPARFASLQRALEARPRDAPAVLQIVDSATYGGWSGLDLVIDLAPGAPLTIGAVAGETPSFIGNLRLVVGAGEQPARLTLEGLRIGGRIVVSTAAGGDAGQPRRCELELRHCTVVAPDRVARPGGDSAVGGVELEPAAAASCELRLRVENSILGPVMVPAAAGELAIFDSIVDGGGGPAIAGASGATAAGAAATVERSTLFGRVSVSRLVALDTIFCEPVEVADPHRGSLTNCFVPTGSSAVTRLRCLPEAGSLSAPVFCSRRYGQPGYGQLAAGCPAEIRTGAANGSEMGAFARQGSAFRAANLAEALEEHLPWGLDPRVFHVT